MPIQWTNPPVTPANLRRRGYRGFQANAHTKMSLRNFYWKLLAHSTDLADAVAIATASEEKVQALNADVES